MNNRRKYSLDSINQTKTLNQFNFSKHFILKSKKIQLFLLSIIEYF